MSKDQKLKPAGLFDQLRQEQPTVNDTKNQAIDLPNLDIPEQLTQYTKKAPSQIAPLTNQPIKEHGSMPPQARRALVSLLRQGVILASQKNILFDALCQYQEAIRRHLGEVYLKLVLDEKAGVAFVAGINKEEDQEFDDFTDGEIVSLLSTRTLTLYDTLLLLVLRKHYQDRENSGEQFIVIDLEKVESYLTPFLPLTNSTKSDRRKLGPALERMIKKKIIRKIRGSVDRYEITPIIRYVVSAQFLESLLAEYLNIARDNDLKPTSALETTTNSELND